MVPASVAGPDADQFVGVHLSAPHGLPQASVTSLAQDADGFLYLGTFGGLARYDGQHVVVLGPADGVTPTRITALRTHPETGDVWVGGQYGDVVRLSSDGKAYPVHLPDVHLTAVVSFELSGPAPIVVTDRAVMSARPSGTWSVGLVRGGRAAVRTPRGVWVANADDVSDEFGEHELDGPTRDLFVDARGRTWAVGPGGLRRDDGAWSALPAVATPPTSVLVDHLDGVWVAAEDRLVRLGVVDDLASTRPPPPTVWDFESSVRALFEDRAGAVWVGTDGSGAVRLDRLSFERFDRGGVAWVDAGEVPVRWGARCGVSGPEGPVEPGTGGCVNAWSRAGGVTWTGRDSQLLRDGVVVDDVNAPIRAIVPDLEAAGSLWIGTEGRGLFRGTPGDLKSVKGLEEQLVDHVSVDPRTGHVWVGCLSGLFRLDGDTVEHLGADRGIRSQVRATWVDPADGSLLVGTYGDGLVHLAPDGHVTRIGTEHGLRELVISSIVADSRDALWLNGNRGATRVALDDVRAFVQRRTDWLATRLVPIGEGNGGAMPAGSLAPDGAVWFPTIDGVVRLVPADVDAEVPHIRPRVLVVRAPNHAPVVRPQIVDVGPNVVVEVSAPYPSGDPPDLRFRLVPAAPHWAALDRSGVLALGDLKVGEHVLEVQARVGSGHWGDTTRLVLRVSGDFTQSGFFRITLPFVALSIVVAASITRAQVNRDRAIALEREMSERLRLQEGLRASEAHYRRVFDAATNPLLVVGADGVVVDANGAALDLHGSGDLVGQEVARCLGDDVFVTADGTRVPAQIRTVPLGARTLVTLVDPTAFDQLQRQVVEAGRSEAVGRAAGALAHDFNNLLAVIRSHMAEVRGAVSDGTPASDALGHVDTATAQAGELVRQLLAVGRRQVLVPTIVDVGAALRQVEGRVRRLVPDGVRVDATLARGCTVRVDGSQLEVALLSLMLQAVQRVGAGGVVTVGCGRFPASWVHARWGMEGGGTWVVGTVTDDGPALAPTVVAGLFEPFAEDVGRPGGALGLSAVHAFVAQSQGRVFVRSEPGHGTSFDVVLPWVDEAPSARPTPPPVWRARVLVVDDEPLVRRGLVRMLESLGHEVRSAESAEAGLRALRADVPQILVTDVLMPGMSGPDLVEVVRREAPEVAVLYVTGYADKHDLDAPVVGKPFDRGDLDAGLRRAMDQARRA